MRRKKVLLTSAIIFIILITSGILFLRTQFVLEKIRVALESQLEKQLKHDVEIEKISGNVLTGVKAKAVKIKARHLLIWDRQIPNPSDVASSSEQRRDRKIDQSIIAIDEIDLNYKILGLLKGKFLITDLHFKKPLVNAELDRNGVLNLMALIPKNEQSNGKFDFLVSRFTIEQGQFNFVDLRRNADLAVAGIGMDVEGPLDSWNHSGNLTFVNGEIQWNGVKSKIDKFSTDFRILKDQSKLKLRFDMGNSWVAVVANAKMKSIESCGSGDPQQAAPELQQTEQHASPVDSLFLETTIISEIELSDLQKFLPDNTIEGKIYMNAIAQGTVPDLSGRLALHSSLFRFDDWVFDKLDAQAEFTQNSLTVSSLSGILADGEIKGSLSVDKIDKTLSYDASIKLTRLDTTKLLMPDLTDFPRIDGFLNGTLKIEGNQANPYAIRSSGNFELTDCTVNDVPVASSKAYYEIKDGKISLDANFDNAQISVNGTIFKSSSLDIRIDFLDVGKLAKILDAPEFSGTALLTGKLESRKAGIDPSRTCFQAQFSIPDAALYDVPIGTVNGNFDYVDGKIIIEKITAEQGKSRCNVRGIAELSDQIPVQLEITLEPLEIVKYRRIFLGDDYPVSGLMNGSISIYGELENLDGEGEIEIADGKVWGLDLDPLVLPLKLDSSIVYIPNLVLVSNDQRAFLTAKVNPEGDYEFDFNTELSPLALFPDLPFSSKLTCKASGSGNANHSEFDVELELADICYAEQSFGNLRLTGTYRTGTQLKSGAILSLTGSALDETCAIDANFVLAESISYDVDLNGENVKLARFLAMAEPTLPDRLDGELDGTIQISGELSPEGDIERFLDEMKIEVIVPRIVLRSDGDEIVNHGLIDLTFSDQKLHVNSFELVSQSSEQSLLKVSGNIGLQPSTKSPNPTRINFSDLTVSSSALDLELVSRILGTELSASGMAKFELDLAGTAASPTFTLDYQVEEVKGLRGSTRQRRKHALERSEGLWMHLVNGQISLALSGQLVYRDNLLKVNCQGQVMDLRSKNQIHLIGEIPIDLALVQKPVEERLIDAPVDLELLAQVQAEFLEPFLADLTVSAGQLDLTAKIQNTLKQPEISGMIDWEDLNLTSPLLPQAIKNGEGDVVFSIRNLQSEIRNINIDCVLNELKFQMGEGDYNAKGRFVASTNPNDTHFIVSFFGKNIELEPLIDRLGDGKIALGGSCDLKILVSGTGLGHEKINAELTSNRFELQSSSPEQFTIRNLQPIRIELHDDLLSVESLHLGNTTETVSISGKFCPFTGIGNDLTIALQNIDIAKWATLLNHPYQLAGRLSSNIKLGGSASAPDIASDWKIDELSTSFAPLNKIAGSLSYSDKWLTIGKTQIDLMENGIIWAEGFFQLSIVNYQLSIIEDEPINLTLKGNDLKLGFLSSFNELVEETNGLVAIDLAAKGTIKQPYYEGTLEVSDFSAKLSGFDQSVKNGKLELKATKEVVSLGHLSCQMGLASFLANGNIKMDGIVPTVLNIENFKMQDVQINDFASAFLDAEFADHLFGHFSASANAKVNLAKGLRSLGRAKRDREGAWAERSEKERNILNASHFDLKFKDVLIEWRDESVAQYKVRSKFGSPYRISEQNKNSQDIGVTLKDQKLYFDFVLKDAILPHKDEATDFIVSEDTNSFVIGVKGDFKLEGNGEEGELFLDVAVHNLDVSPMASLINSPYELSGVLNARLIVRGTPSSPVIDFNWNGDGLTVTRANIDNFVGELSYSNRSLHALGQTTIGKNYAQISAEIPIDISLLNESIVTFLPRQHFQSSFDIKINDLEFVPLIDEQFAYTDANGEINITMGGQISNPEIAGIAGLDNVSFSLPDSNIYVNSTELSASIDGNGIKFDQFAGRLNGGNCEIEGEIGLPFSTLLKSVLLKSDVQLENEKLDLSMVWNDCELKSEPYWDMIKCSGRVTLTGDGDRPLLEGNAVIDEVRYKQSFEELVRIWTSDNAGIQTEAWYDLPLLRNMVLDIELQAPNDLQATMGPLTVENASAYGRLVGELKKPVFDGRMDVLQGELWYLDHKFVINEGYLSNQNPYRFNPKYFISAEIDEPLENIEVVDTDGQSHSRDIKIDLRFSGYLEEHNPPHLSAEVLQRELGEHYEFDQQQIISIITVGSANVVATNGMFSMTDTASAMLRKQAELYVSNRLAKLVGLRSFRLDFTPDSLQQSRFFVTKDLTQRWAISYSSTLQIYEEPYIELEYKLNKHMAIKGERNEEGKYGVDLKWGYEFE